MAKYSTPRILPQRGGLRLSDQQRKAATIWYNWYAGAGMQRSYIMRVLELNPVSYWTCLAPVTGTTLLDISGHNAHGILVGGIAKITDDGDEGLGCIQGDRTGFHYIRVESDTWPGLTGFNIAEFTAMCWFKSGGDNQERVFNIFTNNGSGVNEYCTLEVRTGGNVGLFGRRHDGATEQRTSLINIDDDEWHHIAYYNSNSQNKWGLFVDGQQFEFTRSIAAYDHIVPVNDYPRNLES